MKLYFSTYFCSRMNSASCSFFSSATSRSRSFTNSSLSKMTRDFHLAFCNQAIHIPAEAHSFAGRQGDSFWLVRVVEVVDVDPVVRYGLLGGFALQELAAERSAPRARQSVNESVIARSGDLAAQLQRPEGARLTDYVLQVRELIGGL